MNQKTDMQAAFDAYYAKNWPLCKASIEKGTASEEIVGEREALWDVWQDAWKAALAGQSAGVADEPKRGTDAQILFERKLTCEAINGAIAFGHQNTNAPSSDDHWLAPYWRIGRKQAELEAVLSGPSSSETIHQVWVQETSSWADVTPDYYSERLPSNRRKVYYTPTFSSRPDAQADERELLNAWYEASAARKILVSDEVYRIVTETAALLFRAAAPKYDERGAFQSRVQPWMLACFGAAIAADAVERNHRFFEEAAELVQSCGMTASEAHQLVDYTWSRPVGEKTQEVGGVMVTLAALCLANGLDMHAAGETELARISAPETMAKIRAKQAAKPKHSPLPVAAAEQSSERVEQECPHGVDDGACGWCYDEKAASAPTLDEQEWPSDRDAAIQACALMILGICKTRPQEVWPKEIEGRIRYMLSKIAPVVAQPQVAEPKGLKEIAASFVDWELVERMRSAEEIDSEEAGMLGAMIDSQAREIEALRAILSKGA